MEWVCLHIHPCFDSVNPMVPCLEQKTLKLTKTYLKNQCGANSSRHNKWAIGMKTSNTNGGYIFPPKTQMGKTLHSPHC